MARTDTNRYCLTRLKKLGYVKTEAIGKPKNPPAKWELNYLTKEGYRALEEYRSSQGLNCLPYRGRDEITYTTINYHSMAVKDALVSAIADASHYGMEVEIILDDGQIRSAQKRGNIRWPMEPDYLLVLRYGDIRRVFFGEVDLGTESIESEAANSWRTKMRKYAHYFKSVWRDDPLLGHLPQPDIMTTTSLPERLPNLLNATRAVGGRSSYYFALETHLEPPYGFFRQVWQRIGLDGYHSPADKFSPE